jgi:hypothetical protein
MLAILTVQPGGMALRRDGSGSAHAARMSRKGQWHRMTSPEPKICEPGTIPEWARESIARIAREHPDNLSCHLAWGRRDRNRQAAHGRAPAQSAPVRGTA